MGLLSSQLEGTHVVSDNEKPIYVWPGDKSLHDGTRPLVYVGTATTLTALAFFGILTLALLVLCLNYSFFPMPTNEKSAAFHVFSFYRLMVSFLVPALQDPIYVKALVWWEGRGEVWLLVVRWCLALIAAAAGGFFTARSAFRPVEQAKQVRGRKLLKGTQGFDDIKRSFDSQVNSKYGGPNYIIASKKGFNVLDPKTFENEKDVLRMPDPQRRGHCFYVGGSRRGKGVTTKKVIAQIYYHNIKKRYPELLKVSTPYKLFIVDTPKGEYAQLFKARDTLQLCFDEKHHIPHWISRDLKLAQDVAQYVSGLIEVSDSDPFWGNAARAVTTGVGAFLCKQANGLWGYSHLAYFKDLKPEEIQPIINKYYPEANQIISMGEQSLSSVLGTMSASLTFINDAARIWEGYDYKKDIHQMTAAMLRKPFWIEWFLDKAYGYTPTDEDYKTIEQIDSQISSIQEQLDSNDKSNESINTKISIRRKLESQIKEKQAEKTRHLMSSSSPSNATQSIVKSHIEHLNATNKNWKWVDLKALLSQNWTIQTKELSRTTLEGTFDRSVIPAFLDAIAPILQYAEIWDGYESRKKFSLREWLLDEDPKKKIVLLKPSGRFNTQLAPIIRGLLMYMKSTVNDKFFPEDKTDAVSRRNLHVVLDEFQSLGNIKEFIEPALEMFASKGVTVHFCCQDFSQLKSVYSEEFLKFVLANTTNTFIMGMNSGDSAELISNMVGKKHISKQHLTRSSDGSTSTNVQVHDNEMVITPDEVNSFLGTRFKGESGEVTFLYLPGNEKDCYLLTTPIERYPTHYVSEPADWIKGITYKPSNCLDAVRSSVSAYGEGGTTSTGGTGMTKPVIRKEPAPIFVEPIHDAADELNVDFELEEEELAALAESQEQSQSDIAPIAAIGSAFDSLLDNKKTHTSQTKHTRNNELEPMTKN